jgi:hypothetical protein
MSDVFKVSYQNNSVKLLKNGNDLRMMNGNGNGNGPVIGSPINLDAIAAYLRNYQTTSSVIGGLRPTEFFEYILDGNGYQINDGGNDMFDNGNYTMPALLDNTTYLELDQEEVDIPSLPLLSYNVTTTTVADTNFYYVSLGYDQTPDRRPLTMLATRSGIGNPIGFQKAGDVGADSGGELSHGDLYTGQTLNGFTTHAWYRQTYGQSDDPTVCDLYILLGHSAWNSVFGTVENNLTTDTNQQGAQFRTFGANTQNVLAITTLLSRDSESNNRQITLEEIQAVVQNYTFLIGQVLGG